LRIWTLIEIVVGLLVFGFVFHLVKPYIPTQLAPLITVVEAVFNTIALILRVIIDVIITILNVLKGLIPTLT